MFLGQYNSDDVKVQSYAIALSSLLLTMEDNLTDFKNTQAKATSSKTWTEYLSDFSSIIAGTMSSTVNNINFKIAFETCGLSMDILKYSIESVNDFEQLEQTSYIYLSHRDFLEIIKNNKEEPLLAKAAEHLITVTDFCFEYRMKNFADLVVETKASQFFSVLDNVIKTLNVDELSSGEWASLNVLNKVADGLGSFKIGVDIGQFMGDVFINSSDHILRYYEITAMSFTRKIIIKEIENQTKYINKNEDVNRISRIRDLMMNLAYINARGMYCVYKIQAEDVGIFSKINFQIHSKSLEEWIEGNQYIIKNLIRHLSLIFPDIEMYKVPENNDTGDINEKLDLEELSEERLKEIISSIGIIGAWHYDDYDGNGQNEAFAVIIDFDSKDYRPINSVVYIDSIGTAKVLNAHLNWSLYSNDKGYCIEYDGKKFFHFDMGAYGSGYHTGLFSVKNNSPYELNLSQDIQGFYKRENGIIYTTIHDFSGKSHRYLDCELIYDAKTQQFSFGEVIND